MSTGSQRLPRARAHDGQLPNDEPVPTSAERVRARLEELTETITAIENEGGVFDRRLLPLLFELSSLLELEGNYRGAEKTLRKLLAIGEQTGTPRSAIAHGLLRLARLCTAQNKKAEAVRLERMADRLRQKAELARELSEEAHELQRQGKWRRALATLREAAGQARPNDPLVRLNLAICRFHMGAEAAMAHECLALVDELPPPQQLHGLVLALIGFDAQRDRSRGRYVARQLIDRVEELDPWELPTVASAVSHRMAVEERAVDTVVAALQRLMEGATTQEAWEISGLIGRYLRRASEASAESQG